KAGCRTATIDGAAFTMTGIAKGAGMIRPDMGTMLSIVATDAAIEPELLQQWVRDAADQSFNRITVDGDTSTNDSLIVVATGAGQVRITDADSAAALAVRGALFDLTRQLAQMIIRDGEGATKFITIRVEQAATENEAGAVAYSIAHSPLVKTAFFASDANLGRLLCAIGYAGITDLDVDKVELLLGDVLVASNGGRHPDYQEAAGQLVMAQDEITVTVRLNRGQSATTVWTCDLSHDYVTINAEYRT
ncbi:MAG: bifunctional ornithine acetyltransferase/N-acetylglutamate synthase, partial [Burkholderiaceae bacterium]